MEEDAEEALTREMYRSLGHFAKEHIWSEEEYDLVRRNFLRLSKEELLLNSNIVANYLNQSENHLRIIASWEPTVPSSDTVIRRYRKFDRFLEILDNSALWFSRTDVFEDHFEGAFPQPNLKRTEEINEEELEIVGEGHREVQQMEQNRRQQQIEEANKRTYINCWRWGDDESAVFWNAYVGDDLGVAIESTVDHFRSAIEMDVSEGYLDVQRAHERAIEFIDSPLRSDLKDHLIVEKSKMQIGSVEYLDYEEDSIPDNQYSRFFHKRSAFEEEHEFRAIFEVPLMKDDFDTSQKQGTLVQVNLDSMIDTVYLKPNAPNWFAKVIKYALKSNDITAPVKRSKLDQNHPDHGKSGFPGAWSGPLVDLDAQDEGFKSDGRFEGSSDILPPLYHKSLEEYD